MTKIVLYVSCAPSLKYWRFTIPESMQLKKAITLIYQMIASEINVEFGYSEQMMIVKKDDWRILIPTYSIKENQLVDGNTIVLF